MTCDVIEIGASKGVKLPSFILKKLKNPDSFELNIEEDRIILIPKRVDKRVGWDEAFKAMAKNCDDILLIDDKIDLDLL